MQLGWSPGPDSQRGQTQGRSMRGLSKYGQWQGVSVYVGESQGLQHRTRTQ